MAMQAYEVDEFFVDPDELKMPESPMHRSLAEMVAAATDHQLGSAVVCYRDMNWYPLDGLGPLAPDVFVLPPATLAVEDRSYRQQPDGPTPTAVVEVPSHHDRLNEFRAKLRRYRQLGVAVYVLYADIGEASVERWDPADDLPRQWLGQPVAEFGNFVLDCDKAGRLVARTSDGLEFASAEELRTRLVARAEEAVGRVAELEARLRSLGIDP